MVRLHHPSTLQRVLNWYPPWWGAGIRVVHLQEDYRRAVVEMPLTWYNRNYVKTHFGGSLYSMCDPMYMLMLLNILGSKNYIVWDKAASIEYVQPGKGTVRAEFLLEHELISSLQQMAPGEKRVFDLYVNVTDADSGDIVAKVTKTEYVKRKPDPDAPPSTSRL